MGTRTGCQLPQLLRIYGSYLAGIFEDAQLACSFHSLHPTKEGTMIKKIAIAAVLGASAACFYYTYPIDEPVLATTGQVPPNVGITPQQPAATSNPAPAQSLAADDDTEVVLGIRVRKDRNCRVELKDYVTTDGETFSAYSCTPNNPAPLHIYADYDNETLAGMAYSDADAAATLGQRLISKDTHKSYQLLIRAVALDGKVEHLAWLADQAFGVVAINGKPQVDNLQRQYELAALAARLGDAPSKSRYFKSELIRNGIDEDQLSTLDLRVDELLRSMRDIQLTVLGEATIEEQDDA
jgi:hypothetical protein